MAANDAPKARPQTTYTVIYRTGGTERCRWNRVLERYVAREAALATARELEGQGYKSLVHDTARLERLGMPEGWEA